MQKLTSNRIAMLLLLVFVSAAFAWCSFGIGPLMDVFRPNDAGAVCVYFCFGMIGAAAATIAVIGVLTSWPFWFRMPLSFSLGTLLFGLWTIGFSMSMTIRGEGEFSSVGRDWTVAAFCFPLILLAIQTPLWFTRTLANWTISRKEESPDRQPLTIRDMLAGTVLIAVVLAGAQFARQLYTPIVVSEAEFWIMVGGAAAACFGMSLLSIPPVVLATLRPAKASIGMVVLGAYALVALAIAVVIIAVADRMPSVWEVTGLLITVSTFVVAASAPLLIARQLGWRLKWGHPPAEPSRSSTAVTASGPMMS